MNKAYQMSARGYGLTIACKQDVKDAIRTLYLLSEGKKVVPTLRVTEKEADLYGINGNMSNYWDGVYFIEDGYGPCTDSWGRPGYCIKSKKYYVFDGVVYTKETLTDHLDNIGSFTISDFF